MTLHEKLLAAGVPEDQLSHHYSDLYVLATPKNKDIIIKHCEDEGLSIDLFMKSFMSNDETPPRRWYEIPFAYDPYWAKKAKENARMAKAREFAEKGHASTQPAETASTETKMEIRKVDSYCEGGGAWVWNNSIAIGSALFQTDDWKAEFLAWLEKHAPGDAKRVADGELTFNEEDTVIELIVADTGEIIAAAMADAEGKD